MTGVLIKREIWTQRDAHRRTPSKDESRDQGDASTRQGATRIAVNPPEPGAEALPRFSLTKNPVDTLISDLQPPELGENECLLVKPPSLR